jgi:alkanesulfonate monooxygenase SsuD/methylene tetrahydromethanopterin reductase-like flavin-dependent oxidoreductase (luciferase family)
VYALRFDLRTPDPDRAQDLYEAAVEMAAWGEQNGCVAVTLSEHHASDDGYLPSPMLVAAAMAARTSTLLINLSALILPFQDPVRLAEDMAVLHRLSRGRVSYVLGLGYRPEEYRLHGVPWEARGAYFEQQLEALLAALRSDAVTPSEPGVLAALSCGGRSAAAARRAGRLGLGFMAQANDPSLAEVHRSAALEAGVAPGPVFFPPADLPLTLFVADDVDAAWDEIGSYLLHDATTYAAWNAGDTETASLSRATTLAELRAEEGSHRIVDVPTAVELARTHGMLALHPLCGGIPPEVAWPYVERVVRDVLPAAAAPASSTSGVTA